MFLLMKLKLHMMYNDINFYINHVQFTLFIIFHALQLYFRSASATNSATANSMGTFGAMISLMLIITATLAV